MMKRLERWLAVPAVCAALVPGLVRAQGVPAPPPRGTASAQPAGPVQLSLPEAIARAMDQNPDVRSARAALEYAEAQSRSAWSNAMPQFNTSLAYQRALRSVFQSVGFTLPDSMKFTPDPNAPLADRVKYLEDKSGNQAYEALGNLFSNMPFGRANTWVAGLSVTQPIFTGGRVKAGISIAGDAADAAHFSLDETRSEIALEVKTGYYDAELAERSVGIVEQSVALAREHLKQVQLRFEAGRASELDTLRAAVDLANLLPQLQAVRNGRDLAMLNMKRLLKLPADADLRLTTELSPKTQAGTPVVALQLPTVAEAQPQLDQRGAFRAAGKAIDMRRAQVTIARAAFMPMLAFSGAMNRQAFPNSIRFPSGNEWRDDWNVGLAVSWPLFQGLRRTSDLDAAHAQVKQAQVQQEQLRDGLRIQYQQALGEFERGKALVDAATRTAVQAQRVYDLTELRYGEGLATQLDVSSARLALQQARINEVQAFHDAYAALARAERTLGVPPDAGNMP